MSRTQPYPGLPLSPRENELMALFAAGNTYAEAAFAMGITRWTVKNHATSILVRMDRPNITSAVAAWCRQGH